jgi:hypothetical protein
VNNAYGNSAILGANSLSTGAGIASWPGDLLFLIGRNKFIIPYF